MSIKSNKNNHNIRQVLRSIAEFEPPQHANSVQMTQQVEKAKLQEGLTYLFIKAERQEKEIRVLSEQLSQQINLREQILQELGSQRQKTQRIGQRLANSNKTISRLRKQLDSKQEARAGSSSKMERMDSAMKCMTTRRGGSVGQNERQELDIVHRLKVAESRLSEWQRQSEEWKEKEKEQEQRMLFAEEHLRRAKQELKDSESELELKMEEAAQIQLEMKEIILRQRQQIKKLQSRQTKTTKQTPQLKSYRSSLANILSAVADSSLRDKLSRDLLKLLASIQTTFDSMLVYSGSVTLP